MKSIEQSDIQLAALRSASFLSTKIQSTLPDTTQFDFFEYSKVIKDVPCLDQTRFFQEIEACATKFFMEWFGSDNDIDFSVRRRIALQGIKDTINEQFWKNVESCSEIPRNITALEKALEPYEKSIKKQKKSTHMFPMFFSDNFYKEHSLLTKAQQKGGIVSGDMGFVVQVAHRQFVEDLSQRFNQILSTVGVTTPFVHSKPWLSNRPLEQRLVEKREKAGSGIQRPPVRPPIQTSY